ncbi:hypothetical protein K788_00002625 [Paraburkholderia caribensis MBA4]|uniref:Uncharacterized protein n=1 Tax=Paraburkholderia caribensis MBA4 TaxID=1323664 RepID=A0A0P0RIG4_9BURK|nr:hypothetical protein K788_00002625 [Paraburkholderia caribensis MBA4]
MLRMQVARIGLLWPRDRFTEKLHIAASSQPFCGFSET